MPVLLIAEADLPEEAYAEIADRMTPLLRQARGFICHAGGPDPAGGWRVVEIWESEQDGQNWFDHHIRPSLPPGVMPKNTYYPLRTAVTKEPIVRARPLGQLGRSHSPLTINRPPPALPLTAIPRGFTCATSTGFPPRPGPRVSPRHWPE